MHLRGHKLKGDVLLRREISLKVICEKSNFQTDFCTIFMTMNGHTCTYKLFKDIFNDFLIEGKGEIDMVR